jgi:hypothetical protein
MQRPARPTHPAVSATRCGHEIHPSVLSPTPYCLKCVADKLWFHSLLMEGRMKLARVSFDLVNLPAVPWLRFPAYRINQEKWKYRKARKAAKEAYLRYMRERQRQKRLKLRYAQWEDAHKGEPCCRVNFAASVYFCTNTGRRTDRRQYMSDLRRAEKGRDPRCRTSLQRSYRAIEAYGQRYGMVGTSKNHGRYFFERCLHERWLHE